LYQGKVRVGRLLSEKEGGGTPPGKGNVNGMGRGKKIRLQKLRGKQQKLGYKSVKKVGNGPRRGEDLVQSQ